MQDNMLNPTNLRYIVFLIDSAIKQHDGKIFASYSDAREYVDECLQWKYADKAVIGLFYLDGQSREMLITMIDTIGFKRDKKDVNQLQLFKMT